jgi:hypothetical protein
MPDMPVWLDVLVWWAALTGLGLIIAWPLCRISANSDQDADAARADVEDRALLRQREALEAFGRESEELFGPDAPTARGTRTDGIGRG